MKDKIIAALKEAGLDEALQDKIRVKDESEIEGAVKKLKARHDLTELIKENGLDGAFTAEMDAAVSKGILAFETRLKKEGRLIDPSAADKDTDDDKKKGDDKKGNDMDNANDAIKKMIEEALNPVIKTVQTITEKDRQNTVKEKLKVAGLPENFFKFVNADTEDAMSEEIDALKKQYTDSLQAEIDSKLKAGEYIPSNGKPGSSASIDKIKQYAESRQKTGAYGDTGQPFEGAKLNIDED